MEKSEIIWNYDPAALVIADTFTFKVAARLVKVTAGKGSPLKQYVEQTVAWACTNCKQESAGSTNRTIDDLKYVIWAARVCPGGVWTVRLEFELRFMHRGVAVRVRVRVRVRLRDRKVLQHDRGGAVRVRVRAQVEVTSGTVFFFSPGGGAGGAVRVRGRVRGRTAVRALLPERGGAVRVGVQVRMGGQFEFEFECALLLRLFFICIVYLASSYLYWYLSRLVPMYFFLGTHCGGSPPAPPPAYVFLTGSPCYLLLCRFFTCIVYLGSSYLYWYICIGWNSSNSNNSRIIFFGGAVRVRIQFGFEGGYEVEFELE